MVADRRMRQIGAVPQAGHQAGEQPHAPDRADDDHICTTIIEPCAGRDGEAATHVRAVRDREAIDLCGWGVPPSREYVICCGRCRSAAIAPPSRYEVPRMQPA